MAAIKIVPDVDVCSDIKQGKFDALLVVGENADRLKESFSPLYTVVQNYFKIDEAATGSGTEVVVIPCSDVPSGRLIYAPTGPVTRDYDDVRRFAEAASKGVKRAISAGSKHPLVVVLIHPRYVLSIRVAMLGLLQTIYTPIEVREMRPEKTAKLSGLGLYTSDKRELFILKAIESGRVAYRDIGGSDPERMAAPRVVEYIKEIFNNTCIQVSVQSDVAVLSKEYPLLAAVNRAAKNVPRHAPSVIHLTYQGEAQIDTTLMLVGKGITYDTGGADIKYAGAMAGMHRDKCGAAFVAGFFQMLSVYRPKGLKVIGAMCMVRNSVGSESYVSDEIIISRSGARVRVGNTDAEGRMVMADVLCEMKEKAVKEVNPRLFTIATLTGHVIRAYGDNYTGVMDNGPAKALSTAQTLQMEGDSCGDPFEISTIRIEDYQAHTGKSEYEDVLQSGGGPSTQTPRGHQSPAAFLILASGLDKHGCDSSQPLPYSHLDIAGSSGPFPGTPTGSPIPAMTHAFVLKRQSSAFV